MKWLTIIALLMTQLPLAAVDWGKFIGVVAELESNNGLKRVGDNGKAIGLYQMHKIWVDDYNRITRGPKFSYADRADDVKAARMMHVVLLHYHPQKRCALKLPRFTNKAGWKKPACKTELQKPVRWSCATCRESLLKHCFPSWVYPWLVLL